MNLLRKKVMLFKKVKYIVDNYKEEKEEKMKVNGAIKIYLLF